MMTNIRKGKTSDFEKVKSVMNDWWGGRQVDHLQHELFFEHFTDTVFIAENENGEMVGFINGFYSQTDTNVGYVHFIGVAPDQRNTGLGHRLYKRFFEKCIEDGRLKVRSCTSKINLKSIQFHEGLGFSIREDHRGKIQFEKLLG
jgi:predicted GNAT superfamily acetyltransferase